MPVSAGIFIERGFGEIATQPVINLPRNQLWMLAESFGRTIFCQMPSLDFQVVRQVRPDVVIGMQNERFLLEVPYDSTAPTQAELAAAKQVEGKVYGPRTHTATPRVDSFD